MTIEYTGHRRPTKVKKQQRAQKRKRDDVDVEKLQASIDHLDTSQAFDKFSSLPLSEFTKDGLKASHFTTLTDVQVKTIPLALKGRDILGAARTGSGKTLAFLIPVLENCYRQNCVGPDAGLGAMIIAPTRELAIQIFEVLRKIGQHGHMFSAGLVIGGKSLKEEQHALAKMNIVICTPGRILQHLSQTASFSVDNLQMLVLDEADRIMDMGFQKDVDAIVEYLPTDRQTLLFSATQTRKVSDLARLSLKDPEYVAVHEASASATPSTLQQNYVVTPLESKIDTLWSFLQASKKTKMLVFLSSGKQVRFIYESFRKLQPGIPLLHLLGRQKQMTRMEITARFASAKYSCLFATDVAARGLDFPAVDWVVQVDCPEDADTYIHRVGRTARYGRQGRAILLLDPLEEQGMLERLSRNKVPIEKINVRQKKQVSIKDQLGGLCFKDPELKYLGQKSFVSYVKNLRVQRDKQIFQIDKYNLEAFAASMGLPGAPRIKFLKGDVEAARARKNQSRQALESEDESEVDSEGPRNEKDVADDKRVRTKYDRMFARQNQDILSEHYSRLKAGESDEDEFGAAPGNASRELPEDADEDNLFTVKRRIDAEGNVQDGADKPVSTLAAAGIKVDSARRAKLAQSKAKTAKLLAANKKLDRTHVVFEDDGTTRDATKAQVQEDQDDAIGKDDAERAAARLEFLRGERERYTRTDAADKLVVKAKRKEMRERLKQKARDQAQERDAELQVVLGGESDEGTEADRTGDESSELDLDEGSEGGGPGARGHADGEADSLGSVMAKQRKPSAAPRRHGRSGGSAGGEGRPSLEELERAAARLLDG